MSSKEVKRTNAARKRGKTLIPPRPPRDRSLPDMSHILPLYHTVKENPDAPKRD